MENYSMLFEKLKNYLSEKYHVDVKNIDGNTSLLHDLGFKGDDIDDFFSSIIKDFNITTIKLDLSKFHLGDEPLDFLSPIVRLFKKVDASPKPTLKINDIVCFIETGVLE